MLVLVKCFIEYCRVLPQLFVISQIVVPIIRIQPNSKIYYLVQPY